MREAAGELEAALGAKIYVDQDHVGLMLLHKREGFLTGRGEAYNGDALAFEEVARGTQHGWVVVHDHASQRHGAPASVTGCPAEAILARRLRLASKRFL